MGKYIILALFVPLLFSCAARKVAITNTKIETYTDSVIVEKKDSVSVQQNAIVIIDSSEEVEVTPIDTAKPIIIGETKYFNAKVKIKKMRTRFVDSSKIVVVQSNEKQLSVKKEVKQKVFDKKVEKKANILFYVWLMLIPICLWLIWRFGRK
jgi:succinylarginine dihydrolase